MIEEDDFHPQIESNWFKINNALDEPQLPKPIQVYVENEDDVPFWKDIFNRFHLKTNVAPASTDKLRRGKTEVLKLKDQAGEALWLCVDSDYDYLLQNELHQTIEKTPYIFQTYTYSIENYKCYAPALKQVIVEAALAEPDFNFEVFLSEYSKIIFDLFVLSVYYHEAYSDSETENPFCISDFNEVIKILQLKKGYDVEGKEILEEIHPRVKGSLATFKPEAEKLERTLEKIATLGVRPENTYLFIQGHTLHNNVVLMLLYCVYKGTTKAVYKSYATANASDIEKQDKRNAYNNHFKKVTLEGVLFSHKHYHDCFLMKKIYDDVENARQAAGIVP